MSWKEVILKITTVDTSPRASSSGVDAVLLCAVVLCTVIVPDIRISGELHIGIEEFFVPLMTLRLIWKRMYVVNVFTVSMTYLFLIIGVSVFINHQQSDYRNLLELYKVIKLGVLFTFAVFVLGESRHRTRLYRLLEVLIVFLAVVNLLHLFNAFGINEWLIALYDYDGRDIAFFGLNSLGQSDARRIIGTMGNPNDNAILILFFLCCFLFRSLLNRANQKQVSFYNVLIGICAVLIVLCQSRTGIVVLAVVFIISLYLASWSVKNLMVVLAATLGALFLINICVDYHALSYVNNTHMSMDENNSYNARLNVWMRLIEQWKQRPIIGFGPNKEYIYSNKLYPENEYIFYLWRYGVLGLLGYCALLFGHLLLVGKKLRHYPLLIFIDCVLGLTAITNNPLTNPKFVVIFALGWALAVSCIEQTKPIT